MNKKCSNKHHRFNHRENLQFNPHFFNARENFEKYQRYMKISPILFLIVNIAVFYFLYTAFRIKFSVYILILIVILLAFKEIVTTVFSMRMQKDLMNPIKDLKVAVEEITKGNYGYTVESHYPTMIGDLMHTFNIMSVELKEAQEIKERYEKNRKELIAGISHDLKTPITSIIGYLDGIKDGVADSPEKMDKYMNIIYSNAEYTNQLIDDLFLLSKLDIQQVDYKFDLVNVKDYFTDIFIEKKIDLEEHGAEVIIKCDIDSNTEIHLDTKMIYRVITNIINNAVKYNDKDQLQLKFQVELNSTNPTKIQVIITDNGIGMNEEYLDKIFDVTYRIDQSRNKEIGGSGLGLSIAKQLIEAHGGEIWVESEFGISTTFNFTLEDLSYRKG